MMTSIDNYLASLPEYEAMKAPFQEKIDELEAQKDTLEAEIAEIESEITDLQEEMETQVEHQIKQAYLKSLSAPKSAIVGALEEQAGKGVFAPLKIAYPSSDSEVIAFVPMKRITVFFSFPAMAGTKEEYDHLHIGIAPYDNTQPWQTKQLMEILKKDFIANPSSWPGIYEYNFGILVPLDKMSEEISRRLSILATHADELDGPLTYSFNLSEAD